MSRMFTAVLCILFCALSVAQAADSSSSLVALGPDGSIWYSTDKAHWVKIPGTLAALALGDLNADDDFDIVGRNSAGKVYYTTNKTGWALANGTLSSLAVGDLNGDGNDDIAGLTSLGKVYCTTNRGASWASIPGTLAGMTAADLDGNGSDDLVGLTSAGKVYYTTNKTTWVSANGTLSKITTGDFDGSGSDDIAGLTSLGKIYYTVDKGATWKSIPGTLSTVTAGDFDGNGSDDLVGLNSAGKIYYTTNKTSWAGVPGTLAKIAIGDLDGSGTDDIAGLTSLGKVYYTLDKGAHWTNIPGTCSQLYCSAPVEATSNYTGEMVYIPAGSFLMGNSNVGNDAVFHYSEELPQHSVTLTGYYIGKYEVTRGQYRQFMDAGGYSTQSYWSAEGWTWKVNNSCTKPYYWAAEQDWYDYCGLCSYAFTQTDNHPVVGVSYYEAEAFCNWAGGHLPTEAQWERAARWTGTHANVYPWGDVWDAEKCNNIDDHNSAGGGYERCQTAPVGSYSSYPSPSGCQDMAGNVWEWCQDWFKSYPGSSFPFDYTNSYRVLRGGSWTTDDIFGNDFYCRCAYRSFGNYPDHRFDDNGFRFCR